MIDNYTQTGSAQLDGDKLRLNTWWQLGLGFRRSCSGLFCLGPLLSSFASSDVLVAKQVRSVGLLTTLTENK